MAKATLTTTRQLTADLGGEEPLTPTPATNDPHQVAITIVTDATTRDGNPHQRSPLFCCHTSATPNVEDLDETGRRNSLSLKSSQHNLDIRQAELMSEMTGKGFRIATD
jgi:hypothetical protein